MSKCPMSICKPAPPHPAALPETTFLLLPRSGPFSSPHTTRRPIRSQARPPCVGSVPTGPSESWPFFLTCILPTPSSLLSTHFHTAARETSKPSHLINLPNVLHRLPMALRREFMFFSMAHKGPLFLSFSCMWFSSSRVFLSWCACSCLCCWQETGAALGREDLFGVPLTVSGPE